MKFSLQDAAYRHALSLSWPAFFALWAALFLGLNGLFAGLYILGGDDIAGAKPGAFVDFFFFSVETFATVGFGDMVPRTIYARLVVTGETFCSISSLALATGMIFTRFSKPNVHIVFAPSVAFATIAGLPTMMLKLGNRRRDAIVEATARLWMISLQNYEGREGRRYVELRLDKPDHPIFQDAWTLFHTIDASSPLVGMDQAALVAAGACFLVTFRGVDERTAQPVTARREYSASEIVWERRFKATPHVPSRRRPGACLDFELIATAGPASSPSTASAAKGLTDIDRG